MWELERGWSKHTYWVHQRSVWKTTELSKAPRPWSGESAPISGGQPSQGLVPVWYHDRMAMNLRVPEDLDRRLEKLAVEEHASKSALLLQGAELVLQRHARRREISEGLDFVMSHDADLLKRLEDA